MFSNESGGVRNNFTLSTSCHNVLCNKLSQNAVIGNNGNYCHAFRSTVTTGSSLQV